MVCYYLKKASLELIKKNKRMTSQFLEKSLFKKKKKKRKKNNYYSRSKKMKKKRIVDCRFAIIYLFREKKNEERIRIKGIKFE